MGMTYIFSMNGSLSFCWLGLKRLSRLEVEKETISVLMKHLSSSLESKFKPEAITISTDSWLLMIHLSL
jgi:hypothetical protein